MNKMKKRVLLIAQSALCVVIVLMLAAGAIGIYRNGIAEKLENPLAWIYTREKAAAALLPVLPVFLISLGVTIVCAVLRIRDEEQDKPVKDPELLRDLMLSRVAVPDDAMKREQALQKKLRYGGWGGFAVCMLPVMIYMTNKDHFPNGDLEQVIGAMAAQVFPWIVIGFICLITCTVLQGRSIQREYDAIMARVREEKAGGIKAQPEAEKPAENYLTLRRVLLVLSVVFIIAGIRNGSMLAVINKAIRICTECVGLG